VAERVCPTELFVPSKTWPSESVRILEHALQAAGVGQARQIAEGFGSVREQDALYEEANYRAIEESANERIAGRGIKVIFARDEPPAKACGRGDLWVDLSQLNPTLDPSTAVVTPVSTGMRSDSAVKLPDGRVLYVWSTGSTINQGYAVDVATFSSTSGSVTFDKSILTGLTNAQSSVFYVGSRLLLLVLYRTSTHQRVELHESVNHGISWSLVSRPQDTSTTVGQLSDEGLNIGIPLVLSSGRWLVPMIRNGVSGSSGIPTLTVYRTDDSGATWAQTVVRPGTSTPFNITSSRTLIRIGGTVYLQSGERTTTGRTRVWASPDDGVTWTQVSDSPHTNNPRNVSLFIHPSEPGRMYAAGRRAGVSSIPGLLFYTDSPGSAPSTWEVAPGFEWPFSGSSDTNNQRWLVQDVGGHRLTMGNGQVGTLGLVPDGIGRLWVWDGDEWKPVSNASFFQHTHNEYASEDHTHTEEPHTHGLNDLSDINAPSPADGDVLTFDAASGLWVPRPPL
jgi:hypothetical protein